MKRQLLLGSALLTTLAAFPQSGKVRPVATGKVDMFERLSQKYQAIDRLQMTESNAQPQNSNINNSASKTLSAPTTSASWQAIGGSMNIYGVLVSNQRPLNYSDELGVVSFIHRKGNTSTTSPQSNSGSIIGRYSSNWGTSWDSTCIWANGTQLARYPQGGIYNPSGNTNPDNAYFVGMGPVTGGSGWLGNWYASKQLGAANNNFTASATPGAQQFIANTGTFAPNMVRHDFARTYFSATDDGAIRTIAGQYGDINSQTNALYHGFAIIKGTFNAGVFTWSADTLDPTALLNNGSPRIFAFNPNMAWNESGTVGYAMFVGVPANGTLSTRGYQPLVYKTTNSGASWSAINGIDFNKPMYKPVLDKVVGVAYPQAGEPADLTIPWFNTGEGLSVTVDKNNKLHIVSTIFGHYSGHIDSIGYTSQFGTEKYTWPHTPGARAYLWDFYGDGGSDWSFQLIDSLPTEGPGGGSTDPGYSSNPWDADPANQNSKVTSDSRIQVGRTTDGNYLVYSWAESDTNFTPSKTRWNSIPNVKARLFNVTSGTLSPTEINVTKPATGANGNVANRAMFHYMSAECATVGVIGAAGTQSISLRVPLTVSNSNPYSQLTENRHWYSSTVLDFALSVTGINEMMSEKVNSLSIYPNPANDNAVIAIDMKQSGKVNVEIYNITGQLVKSELFDAEMGANKANMDISALNSGIYIVNVKVGNATSVSKLIVE